MKYSLKSFEIRYSYLLESYMYEISINQILNILIYSTDYMPKNISLATDEIKPYNLMPVYGEFKTWFYAEMTELRISTFTHETFL